jgi:hypothetical protein
VLVGDVVEAYIVRDEPKKKPPAPRPAPPKPTPPPAPVAPEAPIPEVDPHTRQVLTLWTQTTGRPAAERIAAWEAFLVEHPDSPHRLLIEEDLTRLREFREKLGAYETKATATEPELDGVEHRARERATHHERVGLAFAVAIPENVRAASLHYRKRGSETFRKTELVRDGDHYLRGDIPGDVVENPGFEYFVELATAGGVVGSAVGSVDRPVFVKVEAPRTSEVFKETKARSRISMRATYLDYATFDPRDGDYTDTFMLIEADFLYRLHTWLYGVRVGFGSLYGKGGKKDPDPFEGAPQSGFNYGYWEMEVRGKNQLAFMARLVAGLGEDGMGFGVEGRARLGPELGTNLTFAASTLENIGFLSELHLQWAAFPRFPLGLAVALTNQPLGDDGDLGVRFSADLGVRVSSWFQPTLRVSYQGRTVAHSGLGGGLGLVFDW